MEKQLIKGTWRSSIHQLSVNELKLGCFLMHFHFFLLHFALIFLFSFL